MFAALCQHIRKRIELRQEIVEAQPQKREAALRLSRRRELAFRCAKPVQKRMSALAQLLPPARQKPLNGDL
jgi:hypothetical protein